MITEENIIELADQTKNQFDASKSANFNADVNFIVSETVDKGWHITVKDSKLVTAQVGTLDKVAATLTASQENWKSMLDGKLNVQMAFMVGKLKVVGDLGVAVKVAAALGQPTRV